jgi:hypothetical protein
LGIARREVTQDIGWMRRLILTVALSLTAVLAVPVGASAQVAAAAPALPVPADWPTSVPVPNGQITAVGRDLTGAITLEITAYGTSAVVIPRVDARYRRAGFTLDPDSRNPRYFTRFRRIVTVFYAAHDELNLKTDLVVTQWRTPIAVGAFRMV